MINANKLLDQLHSMHEDALDEERYDSKIEMLSKQIFDAYKDTKWEEVGRKADPAKDLGWKKVEDVKLFLYVLFELCSKSRTLKRKIVVNLNSYRPKKKKRKR